MRSRVMACNGISPRKAADPRAMFWEKPDRKALPRRAGAPARAQQLRRCDAAFSKSPLTLSDNCHFSDVRYLLTFLKKRGGPQTGED